MWKGWKGVHLPEMRETVCVQTSTQGASGKRTIERKKCQDKKISVKNFPRGGKRFAANYLFDCLEENKIIVKINDWILDSSLTK